MQITISKTLSIFRVWIIFGGNLISDDWLNFIPLPSYDPQSVNIFENRNDYLTGEHDKILKAFESTNKFLENTNIEEIIKKGNKKQNVREIHRVSYLVAKITEESFVVPKCAF